mgnify:CR=1 FL=1
MGRATLSHVDLDTTIARLVVVTHTPSHAIYLVQVFSEQLAPVAVEGNDDGVARGGRRGYGCVGRTNLHSADSITKKQRKDRMTKCQNVAEWGSGRKPIHHPRCEANAEYNIKTILCQASVRLQALCSVTLRISRCIVLECSVSFGSRFLQCSVVLFYCSNL